MATSATRIVIRHLSGSKINQIEQFDLDGSQEITFGRDPSCKVAYDLQRDDEVSSQACGNPHQDRQRNLFSHCRPQQ